MARPPGRRRAALLADEEKEETTMTTDLFSIEEMIAFAESASAVEIEHLEDFCDQRNLQLQDVTSWSTAFETGGKLGVQAMVVHWRPERGRIRDWHEDVKNAVKTFRPRRLRVRADGNRFSVEEIKPLTSRNIVYTPVFQLRVVEDGDSERWFLYWRRAGGGWWPYAGHAAFDSVRDAVAEVQADSHRCFRLHPLH
jgi:hypothetical protein